MQLFASYIGKNTVSLRVKAHSKYYLQGQFQTNSRYFLWYHKNKSVWRDGIIQEELYPPDPFLILDNWRGVPTPANGKWVLVVKTKHRSLYKLVPDSELPAEVPEQKEKQPAK